MNSHDDTPYVPEEPDGTRLFTKSGMPIVQEETAQGAVAAIRHDLDPCNPCARRPVYVTNNILGENPGYRWPVVQATELFAGKPINRDQAFLGANAAYLILERALDDNIAGALAQLGLDERDGTISEAIDLIKMTNPDALQGVIVPILKTFREKYVEVHAHQGLLRRIASVFTNTSSASSVSSSEQIQGISAHLEGKLDEAGRRQLAEVSGEFCKLAQSVAFKMGEKGYAGVEPLLIRAYTAAVDAIAIGSGARKTLELEGARAEALEATLTSLRRELATPGQRSEIGIDPELKHMLELVSEGRIGADHVRPDVADEGPYIDDRFVH